MIIVFAHLFMHRDYMYIRLKGPLATLTYVQQTPLRALQSLNYLSAYVVEKTEETVLLRVKPKLKGFEV